MSNTQYLALTIGPIYRTLQQARKTRELWASSYLFSRLMERLILQIQHEGGEVIKPLPIKVPKEELYGAGMYPDRLFAKADSLNETKVENAINMAISGLSTEALTFRNSVDVGDWVSYWKNYLRVDWVLKSLNEAESKNPVSTFRPYLDTFELQEPYFQEQPKNDYLLKLLDNPYK